MSDWIPFREGTYEVVEAFLVAGDHKAVALEDALIEVYLDRRNQRQMAGRALVVNYLIVELLQDHEQLDMLLDFGDEFKYLLKTPAIQAGKVFAPNVKSIMRFSPLSPLKKLDIEEYDRTRAQLELIGASDEL